MVALNDNANRLVFSIHVNCCYHLSSGCELANIAKQPRTQSIAETDETVNNFTCIQLNILFWT